VANIDPLLQRNRAFADTGGYEGATIFPKDAVCVITCLDPRVDPAVFLQLGLGDAVVIRNAGGRVTPEVLTDLAYIGYLSTNMLGVDGPLFEVAVIHHNQCGTSFLADDEFRRGFARSSGLDGAALADEAVTDPARTDAIDVERLRSAPILSDRLTVSGHVYDVTTGLVTTVIPTAPLRG
jgi:carbonic anhydrase